MPTLRRSRLVRHALFAAACVATAAGAALQAKAPPAAAQNKTLVVLLDRIEPEYKAGAKYRTPATIDSELAEDLARRLQMPLIKADAGGAAVPAAAGAGAVRLQLTALADAGAVPRGHTVVPVAYHAAPMAIMRTDTGITSWDQLKGRTVCVASGGRHAGMAAGRYGATEMPFASVTDALIALRSGACDAAVDDSARLRELVRLPEWKKFSAQLPAPHSGTLAFIVPASDTASVAQARKIAAAWKAEAYPDALVRKAAQNIAFEVCLEQDVPDCH
jgi:polar amino acid transport system substrate-binding protein